MKKFIIWYQEDGDLRRYEFDADDYDHAMEQYHSAEGDEAPPVRLVIETVTPVFVHIQI